MKIESRSMRAAQKVIRKIEEQGKQARLAGGCVRDRLLGREPKDHDVATDALPENILKWFRDAGYKVVPTGMDHGTVTVIAEHKPVEVTTLREDVSTDGRRATVRYTDCFQTDASRRDFTINAMYEDLGGKIYDYFDGQTHLKERTLRFVGDAETRIHEDYLRILRMYRFWATLGFTPDEAAMEACARGYEGLTRVSQERITHELLLLLNAENCRDPLQHMMTSGLWQILCPEVGDIATADRASHALLAHLPPEERAPARLAQILHKKTERSVAKAFCQRIRLSNADTAKVLAYLALDEGLCQLRDEPWARMEFIDQVEATFGASSWLNYVSRVATLMVGDSCKQKLQDCIEIEIKQGELRRNEIPIDGNWLVEQGGQPGPELGRQLLQLKRLYRSGAWSTPEEAKALLLEDNAAFRNTT